VGEQVKSKPRWIVNPQHRSLQMRVIIQPYGRFSSEFLRAEKNRYQEMKFAEKYELLESLTTGAVETFVANDRLRGERVLVHIVECTPQGPDQTTAEWALESFRRLAPEPPGLILETGKYNPPKYAYVVIKPAEETAVKAWIRRYELHAQETKETRVQKLKPEVSATAVPLPVPPSPAIPKEPPQPAGSMTQLLRDFDSLAKSKMPPAAMPPDRPAVRPAPSASLPGESGIHAATPTAPWDSPSVKVAKPAKEPPLATPAIQPKSLAPESPPSAARASTKPGEFTSFFQGPFRGESSSDMPSFSSQPMEPAKKNVGEFTALFGQSAPTAPASPAPVNAAEPSFTSIFKDMAPAQPTFNAPPPIQGPVIPPSPAPGGSVPSMNVAPLPDPVFVAPAPAPVVTSTSPTPAIPPSPGMPAERPAPPRHSSFPGDGATGAFMHPPGEPAPVPVEAPPGPSPYTQIISRRNLPPEEAEARSASTPGAGAGGQKYAAPAMPKVPAAAPPPMPKMPPPPRAAPSPMPQVKAPQMPKAPKLEAPAPPTVSMWPLIITLTVLFFLAVILVLFFALRH